VVPISINNSWKMVKFGFFPLGLGNHLSFTVHKPLKVNEFDFAEIMLRTEKIIIEGINKV
jgi:1-acyl-sn-glycerol-3-phosphate acyltransferase